VVAVTPTCDACDSGGGGTVVADVEPLPPFPDLVELLPHAVAPNATTTTAAVQHVRRCMDRIV